MKIGRVFGICQMIANQIFKIWRERNACPALHAPLIDRRSANLVTTGAKSQRGFYLVFNEYAPLTLITPFGSWTFASIDHEEEILSRIAAFSQLVSALGLDEAETEFPKHDKVFTYKVGKVADIKLPPAQKADPGSYSQDNENQWSVLVIERTRANQGIVINQN